MNYHDRSLRTEITFVVLNAASILNRGHGPFVRLNF
jgi:hypothetical protein